MLKLGICIKEKAFEKHVINLLKSILAGGEEYEFERVSVKDLINKNQQMIGDYPVFIMDEKFFHDNGMETVRYLTRIRPNTEIILVEGEEENTFSGIRYHTFAYQMKRIKQDGLAYIINEKLRNTVINRRNITIKHEGEEIPVPINDIVYAESKNRHIILHTVMGEYEYNEKMYVLEELLKSEGFIRCHQSFIVSRRYITDINSEGIWLEQKYIPVGRTYKDAVNKEFVCDDDEIIETEKYTEKQGVLFGEKGLYKGAEFHFRPEEKIIIGRSETSADIVLKHPLISRIHCVIVFHEKDNSYEVVDFSKNGTFTDGKKRLIPDTSYILKAGTTISFGDEDNVFGLG